MFCRSDSSRTEVQLHCDDSADDGRRHNGSFKMKHCIHYLQNAYVAGIELSSPDGLWPLNKLVARQLTLSESLPLLFDITPFLK